MKKIVITYGLIAGFICAGWLVASMAFNGNRPDLEKGMLYGYTSMILAFSLIFVGIRNYRDNQNGGFISFGKAFRIGLYISLIASTVYVIAWEIDYFYFIPDFGEIYRESMLERMRANGASQAEINMQDTQLKEFGQMYKNPLFNVLLTYTEILPVGLLVSLIAALILRRKAVSQDEAMATQRSGGLS